MSAKRSTLKDIANYLNVSTTTVSRALNDKEDISAEMRKKVKEVAKFLHYKPNSIAISLRKKSSTNLIGLIIPTVDHYFFSTILKGAISSSHSSQYLTLIGESNHDTRRETEIINQFNDHYVSGIIFIPSRNKASRNNVLLLQDRQMPFVLIDRQFSGFDGSFVFHDGYAGAYKAVSYLIKCGRRRIALLRGDGECSISNERYKGYVDALYHSLLPIDDRYVKHCPGTTKEEAYLMTKSIFDSEQEPPDAIFSITDHMAAGVYAYAYEAGLEIPKDIAVIGFSNAELSTYLLPQLTTVNQDGNLMGITAMDFLTQQINDPSVQQKRIFESDLIIRDSTPRL